MSDSVNRYRSSWLAGPCRLVCWGLALVTYVIVFAWRALVCAFTGLFRTGVAHDDAVRRMDAFAVRGFEYLTFQTDEFPAFSGRVREAGQSHGAYYEAKRRLKKSHVAMASVIVFVLYTYVGIAAQMGWVAGDYRTANEGAEYLAPGQTAEHLLPSGETVEVGPFPAGTDFLGHDVLSMTLRGATTALWIGTIAAALSSFIGMVLGALAGYYGGWVDDVIVWLYTTISSIPYLLLLLAIAYVFNSNKDLLADYNQSFLKTDLDLSLGLFKIVVAIGLTSWVGICRIVRGEFIKLRELDYVEAGRAIGLSNRRIIFKHILPNVFHLVLVSFSLLFISAIKFEVILSFLGIGLEAGEPSWGVMIRQGAQELIRYPSVWWQLTAATVAMFFLVLAVNLFADTLRDALDPRLRT